MSVIKAGTYRWNDVLTQPPYDVGEQTVSANLTVSTAIDSATAQAIKNQIEAEGIQADFVVQDYSFVCAYSALRVCVRNDEYDKYFILSYENPNVSFEPYDPVVEQLAPALLFGGLEAYHSQFEWGHPWYQTITIPNDTEVSAEFYDWFVANARNTAVTTPSVLQGLTIPEGVVTQITDASGRVLWSAIPPFNGIITLRPSADISVDDTITLVPADATAAYMLINEEVSDGAATIIEMDYGVLNAHAEASARFSLDGYVPKKITKVTNVYIAVSADGDTANTKETQTSYIWPGLILNDTTMYLMKPPTGSAWGNFFEGVNFELQECDLVISKKDLASSAQTSATTEEMLAEINSYISANGILPNIKLQIDMMVDQGEEKDNGYAKVSQAYVVIECE